MSKITLDQQVIQRACEHCKQPFIVGRGSVYEDGKPISIYLAAMHDCNKNNTVHLAIAICKHHEGLGENTAVTLRANPSDTEFEMTLINPNESPWAAETYLGKMLDRQQALASPLLAAFFEIADHIVMEIPAVNEYLIGDAG
jgi:hypothetical protein